MSRVSLARSYLEVLVPLPIGLFIPKSTIIDVTTIRSPLATSASPASISIDQVLPTVATQLSVMSAFALATVASSVL
jgi:hypothetical protein